MFFSATSWMRTGLPEACRTPCLPKFRYSICSDGQMIDLHKNWQMSSDWAGTGTFHESKCNFRNRIFRMCDCLSYRKPSPPQILYLQFCEASKLASSSCSWQNYKLTFHGFAAAIKGAYRSVENEFTWAFYPVHHHATISMLANLNLKPGSIYWPRSKLAAGPCYRPPCLALPLWFILSCSFLRVGAMTLWFTLCYVVFCGSSKIQQSKWHWFSFFSFFNLSFW